MNDKKERKKKNNSAWKFSAHVVEGTHVVHFSIRKALV